MRSFLVVGLESSCTRHVSLMVASNLGFNPGWGGYEEVRDEKYYVVHRSLPHGGRNNFVSEGYWMGFDTVVICTRDMTCSLKSKMVWHQDDLRMARSEQETGRKVLSRMLVTHPKTEIFSYESAFLIGREYNEMFFKKIGIPYDHHVETNDINSKYFPKIMF